MTCACCKAVARGGAHRSRTRRIRWRMERDGRHGRQGRQSSPWTTKGSGRNVGLPVARAVRGGTRRASGGTRGRRQRAILALLTMHVGEVVSTDRIAEEIWAGDPPPSATRTVHSYVSRLRSVRDPRRWWGPAGPTRSRATCWPWTLPGWTCPVRAPGRSGRPRWTRDDGRGQGWTAPALGCGGGRRSPTSPTSTSPRRSPERLEDRRLEALELRIDADLMLGRHAQLVAELEGLVAVHPLRERFWAQLMVGLLPVRPAVRRPGGLLRGSGGSWSRSWASSRATSSGSSSARCWSSRADLTLARGGPRRLRRSGRRRRLRLDHGTTRRVPLPERLLIRPDTGVIGRDEQVASAGRGPRTGRAPARVAASCSSRARPARARARWWPRRPGSPSPTGPACCPDTARRTSPARTSSWSRRSGTTCGTLSDDELADLVGDQAAELSTVLPEVGRRLERPPPTARRSTPTPSATGCSPRSSTCSAGCA